MEYLESVSKEPLLYAHQINKNNEETKYNAPVDSYENLRKIFEEKLASYNNEYEPIRIVFFENVINHICRIIRIMKLPNGNALLVGMNGKRNLTRLAAFMINFNVQEIKNSNDFYKNSYDNINEFYKLIKNLFIKTGMNNEKYVLLIKDEEINNEEFYGPINEFLTFGYIRNVFDNEEKNTIIDSFKKKFIFSSTNESFDFYWQCFINEIKNSFKIILCFSEIRLKSIAKKFPSIVNRTKINWFHDWPESALITVASEFIADLDFIHSDMRSKIAEFMAISHKNLQKITEDYRKNEKFICYVTPRTFVKNLINFKEMIKKKSQEISENIKKFTLGIEKINNLEEEVKNLQLILNNQEIEMTKRNNEADKILKVKMFPI